MLFLFLLNALAGKTGLGDVEARLLKCEDETVQDEQEWVIHDDPRSLSICSRFVPGKWCCINRILILLKN